MRALLFVPGSDERKLAKVTSFGADVIVVDLEDAVADDRKTAARATTRVGDPELQPRPGEHGQGQRDRDRPAARRHRGRRLPRTSTRSWCPKIEDTDTLAEADRALAEAEQANGMETGSVRVLAIIETPRGISRCDEILDQAPDRTVTAIFGLGDFSVALGVDADRGRSRARSTRAGGSCVATRGRRDGGADRRPVPRRRGCRRAAGPTRGASGRSASRDGSPCIRRRSRSIHRALLGADRRGGRPHPPRGRGVRGGRVTRGRLAARRRPVRRLPDLLPRPPQAAPASTPTARPRGGGHERHSRCRWRGSASSTPRRCSPGR